MKMSKVFLIIITVFSLVAGSVSLYRAPALAQVSPVSIELRGMISSVAGNELTVAGQKIIRHEVTQVTGNPIAGATIKLEGVLQADGSVLTRQMVSPSPDKLAEIQAFGNLVSIVGTVSAATPTSVTIMGKTMTIGAQTQIAGAIQVGTMAKVEGSFQPDGTILVREVLSPPTLAIAPVQPGTTKGLFGTLIARGPDSITVNTAAEGPVNLKVDAATKFRMPGRDVIGKDDLQPDDRLAILARKSSTSILTASEVMVVPGNPVNHHIVGAVTGIQGTSVTITMDDGNKVMVEMAGTPPKLGSVLTAVVEQDSKSGKMRSKSRLHVEQVEDRLVSRIRELEKEDARGRANEIEHLKGLVEDNVARHLGILHEARELEVEARGRLNEAFEDARHSGDERMRGLGRKGPSIETRGTIKTISQADNKVVIQPQRGEAIELKVTAESRIHKDNNERATLSDLKVDDSLLDVRFNPDSKELARLVAKTPKVESASGTVITSVNQGTRTFVIPHFLEKSEPLVLSLDDNSKITRDGASATMDKLAAGDMVEKVEFKDGSLRVTALSILSPDKAAGKVVQLAGNVDSVSVSQMMVSGHMVDLNAQTKFKGRASTGALARVEATMQPDGKLLAKEINISQSRGRSGRSDEIEDMAFQGLVENISNTEIMISGKKIAINNQTKIEGSPQAGSMARVELRSQLDGSLFATEIKTGELRSRLEARDELDALGNVIEVTGAIQSISDTGIVIAGQKVTRTAMTEVKGALAVGSIAKAEGSLGADGSILAREIKTPAVLKANLRVPGNEMEFIGNIESVTDTQLIIFGRKVNRDAVTEVKGTLTAGSLAKVEGSLQADGSILARQIKSPPDAREELDARTRNADPIELRGTIQSVTGNDMVIAGKKVSRDTLTQVTGTPAAGATAKIEGGFQADGSILAREIKIPSDKLEKIQALGNLVELTGAIESMAANELTVLGQKAVTNAQTQTAGALLAGAIVKVEGSFQADGSILAREVFVLPHILEIRGREVELRGREFEGEIRGREAEVRGREAEGEAPRGADSPGDDRGGGSGGGGGGSSGGGGGSGSSGSGK